MEIIITEWALDSYLDLKDRRAFSDDDYWDVLRPDILLLKVYPNAKKFDQSHFWSSVHGNAYKMKWHQMGSGRVQIRLPVGLLSSAYLCEAYVKENANQELRKLARFKTHWQLIRMGRFTERGKLS